MRLLMILQLILSIYCGSIITNIRMFCFGFIPHATTRTRTKMTKTKLLPTLESQSSISLCYHNVFSNGGKIISKAKTTTMLYFSSADFMDEFSNNDDDDGNDNDNDDDSFMSSLRNRVAEVSDRETKLPLVVLDSMLPRQVLQLQVKNPLLMELVKECLEQERPFFGMLGLARLRTGQQVHLKTGVEVEIINPEILNDGDTIKLELKAGRRFTILGEVENAASSSSSKKGSWTEGRVEFLDSMKEEEDEIKQGEDRLAVARAISKAEQLTSPNANMSNNASLVNRWIELAKTKEREPGQIDRLVEQLGTIPPCHEPSERAFWVGALINPLPAMGVALEIRPALLTAKTAEERIQIATDGILRSIKHMDGTTTLW